MSVISKPAGLTDIGHLATANGKERGGVDDAAAAAPSAVHSNAVARGGAVGHTGTAAAPVPAV